ncbi:glycosyltransferase [Curtobacterium sp. PhB115]|uniref:glycosyltransferase n=1 Tax=Curtobacterium sp. PhB115 TaxID=2485173 RepID=UPI000F4B9A47|nr:glycosyltransferase [Curtobacterium sp. PhB115]ROP74842.1 glycosyltransferase involved in cell wall biosynthesis [Curtobacterium sp. PhB115]
MTSPNPGLPRVAFVTHSAALSGAELFVARVAAAARRIHPVVVLGEHGPLEQRLAESGVETVVVPLGEAARDRSAGSGLRSVPGALRTTARTTLALRTTLRSRRIDVVTTHSAKAHVYGAIAARLAGIPVVAHVHDVARGSHLSTLNGMVLRAAIGLLPSHRVANSAMTRRSLGRVGRTAAVVGCPAALPQIGPAPDGPLVLGMFGRLAPWKGQDLTIRAFAAADATGLPSDARLRIVGGALFDGDRAYAAALEQLVTDLGLEARVDFTGHVTDVASELSGCHAIVHASRRPEPFGQVVVEAMAAGRALVAADAGGPADLLDHDRSGLLVDPEDTDALAAAIVRMADAPTRDRLATAARTAAEPFRQDRIVARLEDEYLRPLRR